MDKRYDAILKLRLSASILRYRAADGERFWPDEMEQLADLIIAACEDVMAPPERDPTRPLRVVQ